MNIKDYVNKTEQIKATTIKMVRGDSAYFYTMYGTRANKDEEWEIVPFIDGIDTVKFTVSKDPNKSDFLLQKIITEFTEDGKAHIIIDPADTAKLDYGVYGYDIQHSRDEDSEHPYKKTYIRNAKFILMEEYTHD